MSGETSPRGAGKYRPIATLGEGGMARVVLTLSSGPAGVRKLLVVKEIRPELAQDSEFVTMFLDEARLAARLSHPNVIHTYEVGIEDSGPFIVMEYLSGQSLQALIAKVKRANMPLGMHLRIISKVLAGLHYAHELEDYNGARLSVVHRDVSPQNVFICYDGHVKVVDFGVAKVAGSADRTAAGTFKGKIGYIAPEQLSGASVDRRADIFSVGVMLWEALAERRLTANETAATVVHKRMTGMQPRIKDVNPDIPDELAAICDRATAFVPADRFATAAQMEEALEAYIEKAGLRTDERDISALVSQAFELERTRIAEIIEEQIGRASEGKKKVALPNLGAEATSGSASPPGMAAGSTPPSFAVTRHGVGASSWNRKLVLAGGAGLLVLFGIFVARWTASPTSAPSPPSSRTVSTSDPAKPSNVVGASEAPTRSTIALAIRVAPPNATALLDGAPLRTMPFRSVVPKDSKVHTLSVSAPGYTPEERLVRYVEDATIDVVLQRSAARSPGPQGAAMNPAPAPGSDLKKTPRNKPSIDEEDPYQ